MSQICGLWLNDVAALATEAICLSVAIQFTQNFLGVEPESGQVCKFVKELRPDLLGVCTAGIEAPCKLVEVGAHLAALGKQGGNSGQGFFSAASNDNSALDLCTVQRTADEGGQGEMKEFCSTFEFQFFAFRHSELDDVRFVVRRVVVLGIARGRLNIRFGHCTSCLFDNSSVKLCKHDTPLLFAPSGANYEQGLGWDRVCEAQRSNESPSGAFKRQRGLRQQMEGRCPDKRYPNKLTWNTRKSLRSEVPDGQNIFKN